MHKPEKKPPKSCGRYIAHHPSSKPHTRSLLSSVFETNPKMSLQVGDEAWATEPDNHFSLVKIVEDKGDSFLAAPREHSDDTGVAAAASEPKLYKKALLHATNPRFMDGVEDMIDLSHLHEVRSRILFLQSLLPFNLRLSGCAAAQRGVPIQLGPHLHVRGPPAAGSQPVQVAGRLRRRDGSSVRCPVFSFTAIFQSHMRLAATPPIKPALPTDPVSRRTSSRWPTMLSAGKLTTSPTAASSVSTLPQPFARPSEPKHHHQRREWKWQNGEHQVRPSSSPAALQS